MNCCTPKAFYIIWGGSLLNHQKCKTVATAQQRSPHTSYRWKMGEMDPIQWVGIFRRPWLTSTSGENHLTVSQACSPLAVLPPGLHFTSSFMLLHLYSITLTCLHSPHYQDTIAVSHFERVLPLEVTIEGCICHEVCLISENQGPQLQHPECDIRILLFHRNLEDAWGVSIIARDNPQIFKSPRTKVFYLNKRKQFQICGV